MPKVSKADKEEATRDLMQPGHGLGDGMKRGETVWTVLRHVSASGMVRDLDLFVMRDNEPRRITWSTARLLGLTYNKKTDAARVHGCGMDMGWDTVHHLASALFGDADALKQRWL